MDENEAIVSGVKWKRYALEFSSADGRFAFNFYAISDDHAEILLQDLKETAKVLGPCA